MTDQANSTEFKLISYTYQSYLNGFFLLEIKTHAVIGTAGSPSPGGCPGLDSRKRSLRKNGGGILLWVQPPEMFSQTTTVHGVIRLDSCIVILIS